MVPRGPSQRWSFETCSLAASQSGDVTGAEFDDGDAYSDKPVVWTAG
ncbi:hypothetical protein [Streptomyces nigra]